MSDDLLFALAQRLDAEERRDHRYHADCPFCGKEAKRGQKHFSFVAEGYKCWVCDVAGGLVALARHLDVHGDVAPAPRQRPQERPLDGSWQQSPTRWLERYGEPLDRVSLWQAYKPLTLDTIARYRLGVGRLRLYSERTRRWYDHAHRRLILPVFAGGQVVGFYGRAISADDDGPKWFSSTGTRNLVLYNADALRPDVTVIICENRVDALLAQQAEPSIVAVSGGGVAWQEAWTLQIAASRPRLVLCWLDNDLAGAPNEETYRAELARWHALMRQRLAEGKIKALPEKAPEPAAPRIANALLAAGVRASIYQWKPGTPPKRDLGAELMGAR